MCVCVQSNAADLLVLWEKMRLEVRDRTSRRYLDKFGALLKKIKPDYTSPGMPIMAGLRKFTVIASFQAHSQVFLGVQYGNGPGNLATYMYVCCHKFYISVLILKLHSQDF